MSKSILKQPSSQYDDDRPLPLIIAEKWDFPLQYHDVEGEFWYAAQDWVAGLATTSNRKAGEIWRQTKDKMRISNTPLDYVASDEKTYQRAFTNDEGLYSIATYLRVTKTRPLLREIKDYLARAGVFVDMARRDPDEAIRQIQNTDRDVRRWKKMGRDDRWIENRKLTKITNKQLNEMIQRVASRRLNPLDYSKTTNDVYKGVFDKNKQGLVALLDIGKRDNPRDHVSNLALLWLAIAEESCRIVLGNSHSEQEQLLKLAEIRKIIQHVADAVGIQANDLAQLLGIDLITGELLLEDGQAKRH